MNGWVSVTVRTTGLFQAKPINLQAVRQEILNLQPIYKQNRVTNSEKKTNTVDTTLLSLLREAHNINLLKGALISPVLFQHTVQSIAIISKELREKFST